MKTPDELSSYLADLLEGTYDCTDRISVRGYYPLGQTSGGLLTWWNKLFPQTPLSEEGLRKLAGDFGRRVNAYASKHKVPLRYFGVGEKDKHAQAEKLRPQDPKYRGVFAIFVSKASALVWQAKNNKAGKVVFSWDFRSDAGRKIAPGIYLYHILVKEGYLPVIGKVAVLGKKRG